MTASSVLNATMSGRVATASRAGALIDMEACVDPVMRAMKATKHTVHLLNRAFEARTRFDSQAGRDRRP